MSDSNEPLIYDYKGDRLHLEDIGYVPIEELEALVEQWEDCPGAHPTQGAGMAKAKEQCAQELREVIENYE